jgi:hypothetical protein
LSEHRFPPIPTAVYGIVLLAAGIAYLILQMTLLRAEGDESKLRVALGSDGKGKISPLLCCLGIGLAFADRWIGLGLYVVVALIWLVADRRVERHLTTARAEPSEYAGRTSCAPPQQAPVPLPAATSSPRGRPASR